LIFAASCIPGRAMPTAPIFAHDKLIHASVYAVMGGLMTRALGRPALAVFLVALWGVSDELHQLLTPGRDCSGFDWMADLAVALVGSVAVRARARAWRRPHGNPA